ncbi:hypothetical protein BP6252_02817 [Coleophoma cylindrospora]|uniref:Fibroin-3 related protein n=1 Tax=Coleophoma cylindrospora TaxID=1849047 RepID=A0A3D8SFW4_9HELO|nr:hypothetical protein BP6252_02817 [Coleophoma cylindrospora]
MPHISEAMQRSVRRSAMEKIGNVVFRSLLGKRSISTDVSSVANSFSSWNNCMAATYCKWPVIAAIIIGGLILLSIITCICCDCCGGCCDGRKNKPHKHLDTFEPALPHQGYQAPAPMMGGGLAAPAAGPPQYAQFEVGKNGLAVEPKAQLSEDALPPMPSWETASKKRIMTDDEKDGMELGTLDPATGQEIPLISRTASPMSHGPGSPMGYGQPGQPMHPTDYTDVATASPIDSYGYNSNGFNQNGRGFGAPPNGPGMAGPGRYGSPAPSDMGRRYGSPAPQGMGQRGFGPNSPQDSYSDNSFQGGYGRPPPQRQYTGDSNQPFPPAGEYPGSSRGYSDAQYNNPMPPPSRGPSRGPGRMPSPPMNNAGFDFAGGQPQYDNRPSPPQQMPYGGRSTPRAEQQQPQGYFDNASTAPPSYLSRSPPPQEQATYPGYQPYQPASRAPGAGGRQPDRWDPVNH